MILTVTATDPTETQYQPSSHQEQFWRKGSFHWKQKKIIALTIQWEQHCKNSASTVRNTAEKASTNPVQANVPTSRSTDSRTWIKYEERNKQVIRLLSNARNILFHQIWYHTVTKSTKSMTFFYNLDGSSHVLVLFLNKTQNKGLASDDKHKHS